MNNKHEFCSGLDRKSGSESIVTQLDSGEKFTPLVFLDIFFCHFVVILLINRLLTKSGILKQNEK